MSDLVTLQFPLERVASLLKFESVEMAQNFLEHYGLRVGEGCVLLEKGAYINPEAKFPPQRATMLIESKLTTTVGEVGHLISVILTGRSQNF